jgi:mannose-6-phosphate isomerase
MEKTFSNEPLILSLNRVKRAYTGGKLLDEWQGIDNPKDGNYCEEFLISTVEVTNEDKKPGDGLSKTKLSTGEEVYLRDLIKNDYEGFLGADYKDLKDIGVSARIGDTTVRLVLQCHPTKETAVEKLNFPNGKTEAWYILETREIDGQKPCLYVGFKEGVTKEKFKELFLAQDIDSMLDCMHKIDVHKGGVYFVPAGMPHCLGPGSVFLEIHEPCDYTFKLEKDYLPNRTFTDFEMHYGLGSDGLMDAFDYTTYSLEKIKNLCVLDDPLTIKDVEDYKLKEIVPYSSTDRFKVEKLVVNNKFTLEEFPYGHRIAVIIKGNAIFEFNGMKKEAPRGRGVFLPANLKDTVITPQGESVELLICYPPKMPFNPKRTFINPIQIGILVDDLDEYLKNLEEITGMGSWRIASFPPESQPDVYREYHGEPADFKAKFCFYHLGNIEIELIQPLEGKNIWRDWIDKHGQGIHHIKFLVPEHEESRSFLKEKGIDLYQWGASVGINAGKEWLFYDTYDKLGFDLELMNKIVRTKKD